ncbi:L-aspartate oxidase [Paenibacillus massiliensis]|uniref:L-aspartate oxidase n=1 Tax=Paenibacillus massiliensis TaxID=225917 RepID=UPI000470235F|nr:L-aspartate oxidase [Paenibacillus massiliensis]
MQQPQRKIIIIGSGAAALSLATALPEHIHLTVMTKAAVGRSNSALAQGGIATSYAEEDTVQAHIQDTLTAGCGHNDVRAVTEIIHEGKVIVEELLAQDFPFDRDELGSVKLGREGAHSAHRIFHAGGDATGRRLVEYLQLRLRRQVELLEHTTALELLLDEAGHCKGVLAKDREGNVDSYAADAVVIAAGGCGELYACHTNDKTVTGDGLLMAYWAGAELADLEFMQFHPTLLVHEGTCYGLVSEAVRGEGGTLVDETGRAILKGRHPLGDLAPRDIAARIMLSEQLEGHRIYMDIRNCASFSERFPTIASLCEHAGIRLEEGRIPVSPGMHFMMGGIVTDEHGATAVPGLYAIGEAACTGLHGANRLASNSLLETLVTGRRVARHLAEEEAWQFGQSSASEPRKGHKRNHSDPFNVQVRMIEVPELTRQELQRRMTAYVSIARTQGELAQLRNWLDSRPRMLKNVHNITNEERELTNLWMLAKMVTRSALLREESRGAHFRTDVPDSQASWRGRQIIHQQGDIKIRTNERIMETWNVYS